MNIKDEIAYWIRVVVSAIQIIVFCAFMLLLFLLAPFLFLFPNQYKNLQAWIKNRRLARSRTKWFVTGGGHGSRLRYYDRGDSTIVHGGYADISPDATAGRYIWEVSKQPLTVEEVIQLESRVSQWLERERTRFFRFEVPQRKVDRELLEKRMNNVIMGRIDSDDKP